MSDIRSVIVWRFAANRLSGHSSGRTDVELILCQQIRINRSDRCSSESDADREPHFQRLWLNMRRDCMSVVALASCLDASSLESQQLFLWWVMAIFQTHNKLVLYSAALPLCLCSSRKGRVWDSDSDFFCLLAAVVFCASLWVYESLRVWSLPSLYFFNIWSDVISSKK